MKNLMWYIANTKNMMEEFIKEYSPNDTHVFCGGGTALNYYKQWFDKNHWEIAYLLDRNATYNEKRLGIPCIKIQDLQRYVDPAQCKFIITSARYKNEIIMELKKQYGDGIRVYSFEIEIYVNFIHNINDYRQYLISHYGEIEHFYKILEDDFSRQTLQAILRGRISANYDEFQSVLVNNQYFPEDILTFSDEEVAVEVGSNDGSTLMDMIEAFQGSFRTIYCFEPDKNSISMLKEKLARLKGNIVLIEKGAGAVEATQHFKTDSIGHSHVVKNDDEYDYTIEVTTIDDAINESVSYIKMDVEGLEMQVLKGAKKTICKAKPRLAVCVYHRPEDLIEIPQYIHSLNPEYKFYLRHHAYGATETVLYAV